MRSVLFQRNDGFVGSGTKTPSANRNGNRSAERKPFGESKRTAKRNRKRSETDLIDPECGCVRCTRRLVAAIFVALAAIVIAVVVVAAAVVVVVVVVFAAQAPHVSAGQALSKILARAHQAAARASAQTNVAGWMKQGMPVHRRAVSPSIPASIAEDGGRAADKRRCEAGDFSLYIVYI